MRTIIIGGGAAGCFAAIALKRACPRCEVIVVESGMRPLAKVAITGGGRCNLTNTFAAVPGGATGGSLATVYPRGDKLMRRALSALSERDVWEWFEAEGVRLVAQDDHCVFPASQDAMQIVNTLIRLMRTLGVTLLTRHRVALIESLDRYRITFTDPALAPLEADSVIVTTGGHPRPSGFDMLAPLGLKIVAPAPSLFSFNLSGEWHKALMGIVVEGAVVTLAGTRFKASGPLLLTHWGMSGPAILRLSSYAARHLAEAQYKGRLVVNWLGGTTDEEARAQLRDMAAAHPQKQVVSTPPALATAPTKGETDRLTTRHWRALLGRAGISETLRWNEIGKKQMGRLATVLTADVHDITGRCASKDEFVTCGGVALTEINPATMEARRYPGLYFAGEVLDIDALTGGFNLQAAWSTGWVAAKKCAERMQDSAAPDV